jgi:hypothetical protein
VVEQQFLNYEASGIAALGGGRSRLDGETTVCSRRSANAATLRRVAMVLHNLKAVLEAGTGMSAVTQKGGGDPDPHIQEGLRCCAI